jgi:protein tyrosine/serine phosphatase
LFPAPIGHLVPSNSATTDRAAIAPRDRELSLADNSTPGSLGGPRRTLRRRLFLAAAVVVVAGIVAVNHRQVTALRDRFVPKRWGVVEEGKIYRSGQLSRHLVRQMLQGHHIARVVDLTFDNPDDANHEAELAAIAELGIERRLCPLLSDGTGDVHIYAQAVAAVAEAAREGKPVLVHCAAGAQRTGGVVALYRLLVQGKSPEFTFAEMRKYRYDPRTSPLLLEYVNAHIAEIAADLVRDGTLERVPDPLPQLRAE